MNDNIFRNAESRVESYSFSKREYRVIDAMSDATLANQALNKIALRESAELEALEESNLEKHYQQQRRAQAVVEASLCDTKKTLSVNHWFANMKLKLFKDIVFETYYNAIPLDKDFLTTVESSIRKTVDEYIDANGGYNLLESAIEKTNSRFLKEVKACCDTVAREACNKKLKECDDKSSLNFELSDEDYDIFNKKKTELDIDRISELVKDKVITVIRDEKERQTKESELIEDIESELIDDENVTDNAKLDEAYARIVLNKLPVEESTLFNSLMRDSYEELLMENVAIASTHEDEMDKEDKFNMSYDVNFTEDEAIDSDCDDDDDNDYNIADAEYDQTINDELYLQEEYDEILEGEQADAYKARKEKEKNDTSDYKHSEYHPDNMKAINRGSKADNNREHEYDRKGLRKVDTYAINKYKKDGTLMSRGDIERANDAARRNIRRHDPEYKKSVHDHKENEKFIKNRRTTKESLSLDMDKVFAETVARYTLMETLYTIKLESYSYNNIKKLTESLLNKPKKYTVTTEAASWHAMKSLFNKKYSDSTRVFNEAKKLEKAGKYSEAVKKYDEAIKIAKSIGPEIDKIPDENIKDFLAGFIPYLSYALWGIILVGLPANAFSIKGASRAYAKNYLTKHINRLTKKRNECKAKM